MKIPEPVLYCYIASRDLRSTAPSVSMLLPQMTRLKLGKSQKFCRLFHQASFMIIKGLRYSTH